TRRNLAQLWEKPPPALKEAVAKTLPFFQRAATAARDSARPIDERVAAARLLGHAPFTVAEPALKQLLGPRNAGEGQMAAVRALPFHRHAKVADLLLEPWGGYSPVVRREVIEALFARPQRLTVLLGAIEKKRVLGGQLEPFRVQQLRRHPNMQIRKR